MPENGLVDDWPDDVVRGARCYHSCIRIALIGDIMTVISIRGIDENAVSRLKQQAQREGSSLNALAVRLLETGAGVRSAGRQAQAYDDLDALAGTWKAADARAFESATAAFSEVDASLWK